jgi:hypothetical protein
VNPALVDALADCLDRVANGEAPDQVLARYPDLRAELAPMLTAVMAVQSLPPQSARPAFRARVATELARLEEETRAARAPWYVGLAARLGYRARPSIARVVAAALALILMLSGLVVVSAGSRPGELMYPLREAVARLQSEFAGSLRGAGELSPPGEGQVAAGTATALALAHAPAPTVVLRRATPVPTHVIAAPPATSPPVAHRSIAPPLRPVALTAVPTASPSLAPAAPVPVENRSAHRREVPPTPETVAATAVPGTIVPAPPSPPLTPAPSPGPSATAGLGWVTISGDVRQGDQATSRPLVGAPVLLYRKADVVCGSAPQPIIGPVFQQAVTAADGRFAFAVPPGEYLVAVEGGPECLPRRWHVGASDPGTSDACASRIIALALGQTAQFANVLYQEPVGCATATALHSE